MDSNGKDDLKTQFATREGIYRLMTMSEYSRPNRVGYQTNQSNPQVRVSLVTLPTAVLPSQLMQSTTSSAESSLASTGDGAIGAGSGEPGSSHARHHPHSQPHNYHHHHHHQTGDGGGGLITSPSLMTTLGNGSMLHAADDLASTSAEHSQYLHQPAISSPSAGGPLMPLVQNGGAAALSGGDRICFNYGKELYVYAYRGCKKLAADLSKPVDKKLYKGTNPSCHDFNETVAQCDGAPLLVGFTTGQIQLVQPGKREPGRLYNEERFIDKTKVTCLKWLPGSANHFLATHASGHLYLYNEDLPCTPSTPSYQTLRTGDGYTVHACKAKQPRNPVHRWTFSPATGSSSGSGAINEMAFSPCGQLLAIVSQDGFLRVFHYERQELLGVARSYFGGFLCVCWSPDGKYIVVGGEDDLVTVWSMAERRVVARGQGHRSWVSVVAFDPYTSYTASWDGPDFSDDENPANDGVGAYRCFTGSGGGGGGVGTSTLHADEPQLREHRDERRTQARPMSSSSTIPDKLGTSYRLGSVSQDTQLCLWDITEDVLRQSHEIRQRLGSHDPPVLPMLGNGLPRAGGSSSTAAGSPTAADAGDTGATGVGSFTNEWLSGKQNHHMGNSTSSKNSTAQRLISEQHGKGTKGTGNDGSGSLTALGSLTQRLSNFSFGSDSKKSSASGGRGASSGGSSSETAHKKSFTFSKSHNNHNHHGGSASTTSSPAACGTVGPTFPVSTTPQKRPQLDVSAAAAHRSHSAINASSASAPASATATGDAAGAAPLFASAAHSPTGSIVPSYDPLRLIGTAVCPRYDECPLLAPLVCKKIAHERLTALIFREDCFLTACQDGLIYTWARPGFANLPHLPNIIPTASSPNAATGGTVV